VGAMSVHDVVVERKGPNDVALQSRHALPEVVGVDRAQVIHTQAFNHICAQALHRCRCAASKKNRLSRVEIKKKKRIEGTDAKQGSISTVSKLSP
jgi:hypothetical protein